MTTTILTPKTMPELASCLGKLTPASKIISGGTDLVVQMNKGALDPDALLYMGGLEGARDIARTSEGIEIGAMASIAALAGDELLAGPYAALRQAAAGVGSVQVRNAATLGGNVANASPAGDMAPVLVLLNAAAVVAGPDGLRRAPVEEVLTGSGKTSLAHDEAIVKFIIPAALPGARTAFAKLGFRSALSVSRIGLALLLDLDRGGCIETAGLVAGAIAPTPVRLAEAERFLVGKKPGQEAAAEVGKILSALIMKITPELFDRDYKVEAAYGVAEDVFEMASRAPFDK